MSHGCSQSPSSALLAEHKLDSTPRGADRRRVGGFPPRVRSRCSTTATDGGVLIRLGADPLPRVSAARLRSTAASCLVSHAQMTRTRQPSAFKAAC